LGFLIIGFYNEVLKSMENITFLKAKYKIISNLNSLKKIYFFWSKFWVINIL